MSNLCYSTGFYIRLLPLYCFVNDFRWWGYVLLCAISKACLWVFSSAWRPRGTPRRNKTDKPSSHVDFLTVLQSLTWIAQGEVLRAAGVVVWHLRLSTFQAFWPLGCLRHSTTGDCILNAFMFLGVTWAQQKVGPSNLGRLGTRTELRGIWSYKEHCSVVIVERVEFTTEVKAWYSLNFLATHDYTNSDTWWIWP